MEIRSLEPSPEHERELSLRQEDPVINDADFNIEAVIKTIHRYVKAAKKAIFVPGDIHHWGRDLEHALDSQPHPFTITSVTSNMVCASAFVEIADTKLYIYFTRDDDTIMYKYENAGIITKMELS